MAYICDREGNILFVNKAFEELSGHKPEDFIGKPFAPLFDEENLNVAMELYTTVLSGVKGEREIRFKDTEILCEYKTLPLRDEKGNVIGVIGTARNITERRRLERELQNNNKLLEQRVISRTEELSRANEALQIKIVQRKRAEEVLRKAEEKHSRLIENLQDNYFLYTHNTEGIFTYLSPAITNILGYSTEEFLTHYSEYLTDNPINRNVAKHTVLSLKGIKQPPYELEIYHKDGTTRILFVQEVPIFDDGHKVIAVEGIAEDITRRKKTEDDLRRSEATFRSLIDDVLDNSTVGIFILDANFQIIWINKALEQFFGLQREEIIGKDKRQTIRDRIIHIFEDQEYFAEKVLATYANNTYSESFECHVMPEGQRKERWLLHSSIPIKSGLYAGGRIEHYHDITDSKQAEKASLTYQTQLKRLSSTLSLTEERERRHISEDLHDRIGQALTVIKMKLEELSEPQADTDSRSVLNETRELLDTAIHDTRTLTFEISPPLLYELGFEPAVEWLIEQFIERHNISIEYESNDGVGVLDEDISFFLFKSVRELLFNIVKHARADKIKVSTQGDKDRIRISIEDNGIGFDSSKVQYSIDNLSGFGLFSIRERMEHLGGSFDIESKPDQGTRITLELKHQGGDRDAK